MGMLAAMVPCVLVCGILIHSKEAMARQIEDYEETVAEKSQLWVYTLNKNKLCGEEIEEADLEGVEITVDSSDHLAVARDKNQIIGKRAKCNLSNGWIVQADALYEGEKLAKDVRRVTIDFADLPADLKAGEFVDFRIFFPDGEDFVILSKKMIKGVHLEEENRIPTSVDLELNEEEILRLEGAYVDTKQYSEVRVYALSYVSEAQEDAVVNYPVNEAVFSLLRIDPNVEEMILESNSHSQRTRLEANLQEGLSKEADSGAADVSREELLDLFD